MDFINNFTVVDNDITKNYNMKSDISLTNLNSSSVKTLDVDILI